MIPTALRSGDGQFVTAALTARFGLPLEVAKKIFTEQSAKGIIALCWKADLSMKLALALQQKMTQILPMEAIGFAEDDKFPLSNDELIWQLIFLVSFLPTARREYLNKYGCRW